MFPRWVRALFALEAALAVAVVVVGIHLLTAGVRAAGDAVSWATPRLHLAGPLPSLSLPLPLATATPTPPGAEPRSPVAVIRTGNGLLDTLNGSTKAVTLGQIRIVDDLTAAIRRYVELALRTAEGGR